jgi:glycyl-tRNA synthetase alpha chain
VNNVYDLTWTKGVKYGDVHHETEVQFSKYNFELSDKEMLFRQFESYERECDRLVKAGVVLPAYDYCLKCSHTFNLLDAAGAISVTERTGYITRVRKLARLCAHAYLADREAKGFPMLKR